MLPELFKIPGLGIAVWTYGVALDVGVIAAFWLIGRLAARDELPRRQLYSVLIFAGLAAFVGSQLGSVDHWQRLLVSGQSHAGGSSFQALLFFLPLSAALMRAYELPRWRSLDVYAPGIALASAIARLGCFAAGCCWGRPTDSWIGVQFTQRAHELTGVPIGEALIPTQLLLSGAGFLTLGILLFVRRHRAFDGQVILSYLLLYSVACFAIGFWRDEPSRQGFEFPNSQVASLVMLPVAALQYLLLLKRGERVGNASGRLSRSRLGSGAKTRSVA